MSDRNTSYGAAYLAAESYESQLETELGTVDHRLGRLLLTRDPVRPVAWAQNIWLNPHIIPLDSIGDAARKLRAIQRNWVVWPHLHHRRAALIQQKLPHVGAKPLTFPHLAPTAALGSWTLLDEHHILAAPSCSSPFPHGEARFIEDRTGPPNRAYLKLWEALTLYGIYPGPGDRCLDIGASPGGWTWVLAQLGAAVTAIDKAPLDPRIAAMPPVTYRNDSAFALDPVDHPPVDFLFSDVICYPSRLLGWLHRWIEAGKVTHIIATIKFQGPTDHDIALRFAAIPGGRVQHLFHNKHELTFLWRRAG